MNRLTITLDDDLYAMARAHAVATKTSISKAIGDLLRRRLPSGPQQAPPCDSQTSPHVHPLSGFPIVEGNGRPLTSEDVRRAEDDEDIRHLEMMGLSRKEIERGLTR